MPTNWTKRSSISPTTKTTRWPLQSDYWTLNDNDDVVMQDNDWNDILVHTGEFYHKNTELKERDRPNDTEWTKREAI